MSLLIENLKSARLSGVPLIAVTTQDQPATLELITDPKSGVNSCPQVAWDCINGLRPINDEGRQALISLGDAARDGARLVLALKACLGLPPKTMTFLYNGHAQLNDPAVVHAVQNLREAYKENKRTLLILGPSFDDMRRELQADVIVLDEPLPTDNQLSARISELHEDAGKKLDKAKLPQMIDAVRGLPSLFTVEQVVALSFRPHGLDMPALWDRKAAAI